MSDVVVLLSSQIVRVWANFFRVRPVSTAAVTVLGAAASISAITMTLLKSGGPPLKPLPEVGLKEQINSLELMQDNLNNLMVFVERQKNIIENEQEVISQLSSETSNL